jgi:hypothetical protein
VFEPLAGEFVETQRGETLRTMEKISTLRARYHEFALILQVAFAD